MGDQEPQRESEFARAEARTLADLGDFDGARDVLARAIDANPDDPDLHAVMSWYTHKCRTLDQHERGRLAEHHLNVSFELSPDNAQAHYWQGRIFQDQGNPARARAAFEAAARARPDFAAARDALERLGGKSSTTAMSAVAMPVARQKSRVRPGMMALGVLGLLVAGAGAWILAAPDRELTDLARQLGTSMTLRSASKGGRDMHLDFGGSWAKLPSNGRRRELQTIAERAKQMGYTRIYVYSDSRPVAEVMDGNVCLDDSCREAPIVDKAPGGNQKSSLPTAPQSPTPPPAGP